MILSEEMINDVEYVALKMLGKIDYRCFEELKKAGVIDNHRDIVALVMDNKDYSSLNISSNTYNKIIETGKIKSDIKKRTEEYLKIITENDIHVISELDKEYPWSWKQLRGMPKVFFARGDINILNTCYLNGAVSVVGSRQASKYALYATADFSEKLAEKGIVIVSGMALGTDTMAHKSAMKKGKTIAVLPCGVDNIYPNQNRDLYNELICSGLVISELPPSQRVLKNYFPSRNRLISGLADLTIIMEAGEYSGTLHTASFAAAQGKDVFVLPNSIYAGNSYGGLCLLRDGAEVLLDVDTIVDRIARNLYYRLGDNGHTDSFESIRIKIQNDPDSVTDNEWKEVVLDLLSIKSLSFDEISIKTNLPFGRLMRILSELELENKISDERGNYSLTFFN